MDSLSTPARFGLPRLGLLIALASSVWAGSVDNRNNNSAEYIRSLSRNAATDAGDASIYNPAGTVQLSDGLHLSASNQTISKFNQQDVASQNITYKSEVLSPIYPTAFAVYKHSNWSAFSAFSFPGGGGELDYPKGSVTAHLLQANLQQMTPAQDADVYLRSIYYGFTAGGAYAINNWVSVSLAARALYARTDAVVDAGVDLPPGNTSKLIDHMEEARGATAIAGVDVFPGQGLTFGLRVEGPTSLEWEVQKSNLNLESVIKDQGVRDLFITSLRQVLRTPGSKFQRDLPANLGLGAGYAFLPTWRTDLSFNYYFNTLTDWGGKENDHDDGYEISLSAQHQWCIPLLTSLGAQYTKSGANSKSYSVENPALNSYSIGGGGRYTFMNKLDVNLGVTANYAIGDNTTAPLVGNVDLSKHVWVYALGLEYRAF